MLDPTAGIWMTEDPIGFDAGDPNLRRYVGNNATNGTDRSGLQDPKTKPGVKVVDSAANGVVYMDISLFEPLATPGGPTATIRDTYQGMQQQFRALAGAGEMRLYYEQRRPVQTEAMGETPESRPNNALLRFLLEFKSIATSAKDDGTKHIFIYFAHGDTPKGALETGIRVPAWKQEFGVKTGPLVPDVEWKKAVEGPNLGNIRLSMVTCFGREWFDFMPKACRTGADSVLTEEDARSTIAGPKGSISKSVFEKRFPVELERLRSQVRTWQLLNKEVTVVIHVFIGVDSPTGHWEAAVKGFPKTPRFLEQRGLDIEDVTRLDRVLRPK